MKVLSKSVDWRVFETSEFRSLHDPTKNSVKVLHIELLDNNSAFVIKVNEPENGVTWLGPGVFVSSNPKLEIDDNKLGKNFYIRPKITRIRDYEVSEIEVESLVQWLYSKKFKFIESLYYNHPKPQ